jgi:hypothetical protein
MKKVNLIKGKNAYILDFCELANYDSCEIIINILVKDFNAIEETRFEGIGMFFFELKIDNVTLMLINDEYGNCIKSRTNNEMKILQKIYDNWNNISYN